MILGRAFVMRACAARAPRAIAVRARAHCVPRARIVSTGRVGAVRFDAPAELTVQETLQNFRESDYEDGEDAALTLANFCVTNYQHNSTIRALAVALVAYTIRTESGLAKASGEWGVRHWEEMFHAELANPRANAKVKYYALSALWRLSSLEEVDSNRFVEAALRTGELHVHVAGVALWACVVLASVKPNETTDYYARAAALAERIAEAHSENKEVVAAAQSALYVATGGKRGQRNIL